MTDLTLSDISEKMRDIDFAVFSTRTPDGQITGRPMSNNRQVEYDGDNYFFTRDDTGTVKDIGSDPNVGLSFQAKSGPLNMKPFFVTIEGKTELIRDRSEFERHWTKDLDRWFERGVETPGLVLIKVHARRLNYWDGSDQGEVQLPSTESEDLRRSQDAQADAGEQRPSEGGYR